MIQKISLLLVFSTLYYSLIMGQSNYDCEKINVWSSDYDYLLKKKYILRLTNTILINRSIDDYSKKKTISKDKSLKYKKTDCKTRSTYLLNNSECLKSKECFSVLGDYKQRFYGINSWGSSLGHLAQIELKVMSLSIENIECQTRLQIDSNKYNIFEVSFECLSKPTESDSINQKYLHGSVVVEKGIMPKTCAIYFNNEIIHFELVMFDFIEWKSSLLSTFKDQSVIYTNTLDFYNKIEIPPLINFIVNKFIFVDDNCDIYKIGFYPCTANQNQ